MTPRPIRPIRHRVNKRVAVPASPAVTARELVLSALAHGRSRLDLGPLDPGEEVRAMRLAVQGLGYQLDWDQTWRITVTGSAAQAPFAEPSIETGAHGAVARFAAALAACGTGKAAIAVDEPLLQTLAPLFGALRGLGATVEGERSPVTISGPVRGGAAEIAGSAEAAAALLLVAPALPKGLRLRLAGPVIAANALELSVDALRARHVRVDRPAGTELAVAPQRIRERDLDVPGNDALAVYPLAAAAILGGSVTVTNTAARRTGGNERGLRYLDLLAEMGCAVRVSNGNVSLSRSGALHGTVADLRDAAGAFAALACVAACAEGPTELVGATSCSSAGAVKAVAAGLRACGAVVTEFADGIRIQPGPLHGAVVDATDEPAVAMAFSVLGLSVPGIAVEGADAATPIFPGFYDVLGDLSG